MTLHITTIHFDSTTFNADDSLMQLLQAKAYYHELSPNNVLTTMFNNTLFHGSDSSATSQLQQMQLSKKLLPMLSLALKQARPQAFYCTIENNHHNFMPSGVFHDYPMYPFMLTLGHEYERFCHAHTLVSEQYYAHIIGMWMLQRCVEKLVQVCHVTTYCAVYPGSSKEVPLQVNKTLFSVFSNQAQRCGITINEHCMFSPLHTVSGVILPHSGTNPCQHCMLHQCQFRNILT